MSDPLKSPKSPQSQMSTKSMGKVRCPEDNSDFAAMFDESPRAGHTPAPYRIAQSHRKARFPPRTSQVPCFNLVGICCCSVCSAVLGDFSRAERRAATRPSGIAQSAVWPGSPRIAEKPKKPDVDQMCKPAPMF